MPTQYIAFTLNNNREEFDEEKEPDGMVLSGWTQAPAAVKDDKKSIGNGGNASNALEHELAEANRDGEMEEISEPSVKKRKLSEVSIATILDGPEATADEIKNQKEVEKLDDDDDDEEDLVMIDDLNSVGNKKTRLQ